MNLIEHHISKPKIVALQVQQEKKCLEHIYVDYEGTIVEMCDW